ncbi:5-carboxymethyl-2-hydroxymuconate Delta-isomerase [Bacillus cytotoxicus]|uniref:5-carboxymethyl-2-hydroxymuconate isomerase n=1 Tax=Bacillus cytotoxicus TaxID=580165 RepID=A0AAX2CDW8_9BACI|nr:5-carboxymethyl-2-hydroxymuconate Delta-isomerase [Bacillus cytotoxicus]QTR82972.1 5-carboxymethyl-2-hydroxymuconate Delta-isomerase [Bacillus cytotoxicus]QTR86710.1 5-carboxymethyl-2-hydroxymuconate Delta-isomerase [Bacillus cytotoxicus]SCL87117.1 5-carboxymethyl-2-hydroxymuconate isomerase [Bacillus cytotoxicus]
MPHFIVEYTNNIKEEANMKELLKKVNNILISRSDIFPTGGIRSRAIELQDYYIADGQEEDAFVHATLKIGAGRTTQDKTETCDRLFNMMKEHLADLAAKRYFALSMELAEFNEAGTYKWNNIHERFRRKEKK